MVCSLVSSTDSPVLSCSRAVHVKYILACGLNKLLCAVCRTVCFIVTECLNCFVRSWQATSTQPAPAVATMLMRLQQTAEPRIAQHCQQSCKSCWASLASSLPCPLTYAMTQVGSLFLQVTHKFKKRRKKAFILSTASSGFTVALSLWIGCNQHKTAIQHLIV